VQVGAWIGLYREDRACRLVRGYDYVERTERSGWCEHDCNLPILIMLCFSGGTVRHEGTVLDGREQL